MKYFIVLYNKWHLGDCLYTIHYLNKLIQQESDLSVIFYCKLEYHYELKYWIESDKIILYDIKDNIPDHAFNTWIGEDDYYWKNITPTFNNNFDLFYIEYFNILSKKLGLQNPIITPDDLLFDNPEINHPNEFPSFDYLIINSEGNSGQVDEDAVKNLNYFVTSRLKDYRVITTSPINNNIDCTRYYNMTLFDIAQLSLKTDYIIGIHTAPMLPTLNCYTINTNIKWVIIQKQGLTYSFPNIQNIKDSKELFNVYL